MSSPSIDPNLKSNSSQYPAFSSNNEEQKSSSSFFGRSFSWLFGKKKESASALQTTEKFDLKEEHTEEVSVVSTEVEESRPSTPSSPSILEKGEQLPEAALKITLLHSMEISSLPSLDEKRKNYQEQSHLLLANLKKRPQVAAALDFLLQATEEEQEERISSFNLSPREQINLRKELQEYLSSKQIFSLLQKAALYREGFLDFIRRTSPTSATLNELFRLQKAHTAVSKNLEKLLTIVEAMSRLSEKVIHSYDHEEELSTRIIENDELGEEERNYSLEITMARFREARKNASQAADSYLYYATNVAGGDVPSARLYYKAAECSREASKLVLDFAFGDFELAAELNRAALHFGEAARATTNPALRTQQSEEAEAYFKKYEKIMQEILQHLQGHSSNNAHFGLS